MTQFLNRLFHFHQWHEVDRQWIKARHRWFDYKNGNIVHDAWEPVTQIVQCCHSCQKYREFTLKGHVTGGRYVYMDEQSEIQDWVNR